MGKDFSKDKNIREIISRYIPQNSEGNISAPRAHMFQKNITISVCNQKGGCGKTTTAVSIASCLAARGYEVLLVDLDPQAHASLGLGIEVDALNVSIYDVLIHNADMASVILETAYDNLDVAASNSLLSGAQLELAPVLGRENVLRTALRRLRINKEYDFIIIDSSPSLNLVTINGLTASDFVIIPVQTHYYSLEGMRDLFSTIDVVRDRLNPGIEILGIIVTMFDGRRNVNHEMLSEIKNYFGRLVFNTAIRNNVRLYESPAYKKPINMYAPDSIGCFDYNSVSREMLDTLFGAGAGDSAIGAETLQDESEKLEESVNVRE
ncbi:MAG TPA: AAA family ATPase [Candidatus Omnitrophota bacterium]|nr:AAA family ATPase [Candidatus Omnitrophota bacterium]